MNIFVLLGIGCIFLLITGILIAVDNKKRKVKKKMLPIYWRVIGIFTTIGFIVCFVLFVRYGLFMEGVECGDRKILLRSTMMMTDISLPSDDAKLNETLQKHYRDVIQMIEEGEHSETISYIDALLNKKEIALSSIHEVKYSEDLSRKQVQIVEYLVNTKVGNYTKPSVFYYIIFSDKLNKSEGNNKKT